MNNLPAVFGNFIPRLSLAGTEKIRLAGILALPACRFSSSGCGGLEWRLDRPSRRGLSISGTGPSDGFRLRTSALEYRLGYRSYLLPAFPASILWVCKWLGFEHPGFYVPAVKIAHSLASLTIPVGMYLFGRRLYPESVARCMLILGCFWYEFIMLASHAFAEHYSAMLFFLALACLRPKLSRFQLFFVGLLLGFALVFRPAYLYIFIGFGGGFALSIFRPEKSPA